MALSSRRPRSPRATTWSPPAATPIDTAEQQIATLQQQIDAFRGLSSSLAIDEFAAGS
jgi:hypothetical protein